MYIGIKIKLFFIYLFFVSFWNSKNVLVFNY